MDTLSQSAMIDAAAHGGAFGNNTHPTPSDAQCEAGNYRVGRFQFHGLPICIEQPRDSVRSGIDPDGAGWSCRMAAHYGYISGTKGADGDAVDCFVGQLPTKNAYIINQFIGSRFDEHKVMLGFDRQESAVSAYLGSYSQGWQGLHSIIPASIEQLSWWLKFGNQSRPVIHDHLPGSAAMTQPPVLWANGLPTNATLDQVLYNMRRDDPDNLLIYPVSVSDILADAEGGTFDALVVQASKAEQKLGQLKMAMERAGGGGIKPVAMQITEPFRQNGTTNVAAVIEMDDGQTVSVYLHNPDVTPSKLAPGDALISWRWMLNRRDITIVAAPEKGDDLRPMEVAKRVMALVQKNSPAFKRANERRAANMQEIKSLNDEIGELEKRKAVLEHQISVREIEISSAPQSKGQYRISNSRKNVVVVTEKDGVLSISVRNKGEKHDMTAKSTAEANAQISALLGGAELSLSSGSDLLASRIQDDLSKTPEDYAAMIDQKTMAQDALVAPEDAHVYLKKLVNENAKLVAQLKENGVDYPSIDQFMADVASGNRAGFSVAKLKADKAEYQEMLSGLNSGTVRPRDVVGTGGTKKVALAWLANSIDEIDVALKARGIMDSTNLGNYNILLRKVLKGSDSGMVPDGIENIVKTAKGSKVVTGFKVVEVDRLIVSHDSDGNPNHDYPQELQPRDRARATSQAWVQKTARNLDPDSLGKTQRADSGAPIVGPDGVVESGNGRTMAIKEAYRIGKAGEYRAWLESEADYFGLSAEKIKAMKHPVLIRVRTSQINRAEFAVEANQDDKLAMTATEKARSDANRLTDEMIGMMTDSGDLNAAANTRFLSAFLSSLGETEAAQYSTSDGKPTSSLIARVQAAIFSKAYNDDRLLELTADSAKPEIANIISALNFAAPEFIQSAALDPLTTGRATKKLTDCIEASLNEQAVAAIINATNVIKQAKELGMQVDAFIKQQDLFGDLDPSVAAMAVFISKNNRSAKRMGAAFKAMATFIKGEIERRQTADMFGEPVPIGFPEIIAAANRELDRMFGEGAFAIETVDLFAGSENPPQAKDPQSEADRALFQSIIDGTAPDLLSPDLARQFEAAGERRENDPDMKGLFEQAVNVYQEAMLAATANLA